MITNLDHVVLVVSDFEMATAGYEALLGRRARRTEPAGGAVRAWFRMSNISLEIIAPAGDGVAGDRARERLDTHGEGLSLLAFAVDDVEAAQRWLGRRGVGVKPVLGTSFNALAADPATTHGQPMVFARFEDHARAPAIGDEAGAMDGVDHVVIHTPDPERAVALYGGRLGLDLRLDRANPQWGTRLLFFRLGGLVIEIAHTMKDGVGPGPDTLGGLAWRARDMEAAHARLLLAGFSVSDIRTGRRPGSKVFTVRDKTFGVPTLVLSVEGARGLRAELDQLGQASHLQAMKQVNLYEAKTHLSALVEEAAAGEEIVIAKNGKPLAKLTMVTPNSKRPPPIFGSLAHTGWKLPDDFDEPDLEMEALIYDGPTMPDEFK